MEQAVYQANGPSHRAKRTVADQEVELPPTTAAADVLRFGSDLLWLRQALGELPRGATCLLAGDPGVGKTSLALQFALGATGEGTSSLVVSTEQSADALSKRVARLTGEGGARRRDNGPRVAILDQLGDLTMLPSFLASAVLNPRGPHFGAGLLVIDSLQGRGPSSADPRYYGAIYEAIRLASAAGVTLLMLAHITKSGQIAGPKALEHNVDVSLRLRPGIGARALTIPKNRFSPSILDPIALVMDVETTRLLPSPLAFSSIARVRSLHQAGPVVIEVSITLPRYDRGYVRAPGLSPREVETVVDIVQQTNAVARYLWALGVTVRSDSGVTYRRDLNLSIAVGVLAAIARRDLPGNAIVLGDIDLSGRVKPPPAASMRVLTDAIAAGAISSEDVLLCGPLDDAAAGVPDGIRITTVDSIASALSMLEELE